MNTSRETRKEKLYTVPRQAMAGIPIISGEDVYAILVFSILKKSDNLLVELVSAVAAQLGEMLERKQKRHNHE